MTLKDICKGFSTILGAVFTIASVTQWFVNFGDPVAMLLWTGGSSLGFVMVRLGMDKLRPNPENC